MYSLVAYNNFMFNFLRTTKLCSVMATHVTFPPAMLKGSSFSTSSPTFNFFFEKNNHFEDVKWYLILDLIYISMIASIVEHIFSCAYQLTIYVFSLEKYVFQSFAHFCSVYFVIDGVVVLYTLWISVLMRCIVFIYFLFFLWLAFCLWFKIFLLKYSISLNLNCI